MKSFLKYTLATICGIFIFSAIAGILFLIVIAGIAASGNQAAKVEENSVFVINMNGYVTERKTEASPLSQLLNESEADVMGLNDIVKTIRKAKDNDDIKGIYLEGGLTVFDSPATAQQMRDALKDFKKSGKWIIAYADQYLQGAYYVASAADSVFINDNGMIDFKGLGGKNYYLTGFLEKVGVKYQTARVGKYKSAVESLTRKDMSENDREQREAFLNAIWQHWLKDMAQSRKVTPERLNQVASDSIMAFACTDDYRTARLVDGTCYPEDIKTIIKRKLGIDNKKAIAQLTIEDLKTVPEKDKDDKGGRIAVYYACGEIIDQATSLFATGEAIIGSKMVADIQKLTDNDDVKAVVLRVNSPGGSAYASEQIWHALKLLKEKKPLVVSMGGYAASGGYMISAPANYIVAEPTTVTGSIGIFGLIPNFSELATDKLGITWDGVTTNKYGDYETNLTYAKNNETELQFLQTYINRGYDKFLSIVADGRGMTKEQVNEIAQGRVWVGTDALPIKLIDQLGSLDDAVKKAAELAKQDEYHTACYPAGKTWYEQLMDKADKKNGNYLDEQLRDALGDLYEPVMEMRKDKQRSRLQARFPYTTEIK